MDTWGFCTEAGDFFTAQSIIATIQAMGLVCQIRKIPQMSDVDMRQVAYPALYPEQRTGSQGFRLCIGRVSTEYRNLQARL